MDGKTKKHRLPFDNKGGVLVIPRRLVESDTYQSMMPQAKVLMTLLQLHWRNDKSVDYSVREASTRIPCSDKTTSKAYHQLEERGFITCVEYAMFNSRTHSKSRSWRLEWMPFNNNPPNNTWEEKAN